MAKAKQTQAETPEQEPEQTASPRIGDNSELTPAERKALFFDHYRPIAAQLEKVREAKARDALLSAMEKRNAALADDADPGFADAAE